MYSTVQSGRASMHAGKPLPMPFPKLRDKGVQFHQGQLGLAVAGPGTGKSVFALNYAIKSGVDCLYVSADSDGFTQQTRALAISGGIPARDAVTHLRPEVSGFAQRALSPLKIRFDFSAMPSVDDVQEMLDCYWELHGNYPSLVVVDNITNVIGATQSNSEDPFAGLEVLLDWLNDTARRTGAFILGLHHTTGPYVDANKPIPLSGVKGQVSRVPAIILTLFKDKEEEEAGVAVDWDCPQTLYVAAVKNRNGHPDRGAANPSSLTMTGVCLT